MAGSMGEGRGRDTPMDMDSMMMHESVHGAAAALRFALSIHMNRPPI